jgi:predicted lipid-binding transport protein (Tim44 family)
MVRRIRFITVCLAVLLWGLCPALPGVADSGAALPGIPQWHAGPTPSWAAQIPARKSPSGADDTRLSPADAVAPPPLPKPSLPQRGYAGLLKFMSGGLLGGLLLYFVFGFPLSLYWSLGNWPVGFLDVVVGTSAAYLGYRLLRTDGPRSRFIPIPGFRLPDDRSPPVFTIRNEAGSGLAKFSHGNPFFNLEGFVEFARQVIFDLHEAWNHEDLDRIKDRVTPRMLEFLAMGLKLLNLRREISRVEDLALSRIVVLNVRQEAGRDVIIMGFQGRVVDYLLDRLSFKLISGNMTYPERLQECWIFEREWGGGSWLLADIQDFRYFSDYKPA